MARMAAAIDMAMGVAIGMGAVGKRARHRFGG